MILRGTVEPQRIDIYESSERDLTLLNEIEDVSTSLGSLIDIEDSGCGILLGMACCQSLIHVGNGEVIGRSFLISQSILM